MKNISGRYRKGHRRQVWVSKVISLTRAKRSCEQDVGDKASQRPYCARLRNFRLALSCGKIWEGGVVKAEGNQMCFAKMNPVDLHESLGRRKGDNGNNQEGNEVVRCEVVRV